MRPGFVASTGFAASRPLLEKAGELIGITTFFANFVTIAVLMLAWLIVLLAFFVLSVQLFITIIEFKLTVLAGFVLVPFALFGQTAFLAERVLGNVISSGIKLMVLAIVVGIGASLFGTLIRPDGEITLTQAASTILAAIAVFGLAIFVPGHRRRPGLRCAAARRRRGRRHHSGARRHRRCRRHADGRRRAPGWPRRRREPSRPRPRSPARVGAAYEAGGPRGVARTTIDRAGVAHDRVGHGAGARCLPARRRAGLSRCAAAIRSRRSRPRRRSPVAARAPDAAGVGAEPRAPAAHHPGRPGRRAGPARGRPPRQRQPARSSRTRAEGETR